MKKKSDWVYVITNTSNNKKYVGSSYNPAVRFRNHMNALRSGKHICKEMQEDYDELGEVFEYEIVGKNNVIGTDHTEYTVMRALKTYDERYGYNNHDNAMITTINNRDHLKEEAIAEEVQTSIPAEEYDDIRRITVALSSMDEHSLTLIKNGVMLLSDRQKIERFEKERKAK